MQLESITRNNDFLRAYRRGKCSNHAHLVVYVFKKKRGPTRIGITASKKIGNAVCRNRARRVIRHALYSVLPENVGAYDLVFVAKHKTPHLKSTAVAVTIRKQLEQLGVLQPPGPTP